MFKMISVISLITSMEAFLNQQIPNDFIYEQKTSTSNRNLNKTKIESSTVSFSEKLTMVMSQVIKKPSFEFENKLIIEDIQLLYNLRSQLIHMKTNNENEMEVYFKSLGQLIDINLNVSIKSTKEYMNKINPLFIK